MKPRTMLIFAGLLVGFLAYKLFVSEPAALEVDEAVAASEAEDPVTVEETEVEDLEPEVVAPIPEAKAVPEVPPTPEPVEQGTGETESHTNQESSESTVIKVQSPPEYEGRTPVVSLIQNEEGPNGPDREKLDNVTLSFDGGRNAVEALGDQLNALNGVYSGEITREGKDACPFRLTIDGVYMPTDGRQAADFSGHFQMNFECPNGTQSKGDFQSDFGGHARVIGEETKTLLLKDAGGTYFQLSFSRDFYRIMGHAYESQSGSPAYLGRVSAQR